MSSSNKTSPIVRLQHTDLTQTRLGVPKPTARSLLAVLFCLGSMPLTLEANVLACPASSTDTAFAYSDGPSTNNNAGGPILCDGNLTSNSCTQTPQAWHIPITRVVGTGQPADLNTDGTLKNVSLLVSSGVVSQKAHLQVTVVGSYKTNYSVQVRVNNTVIATHTMKGSPAGFPSDLWQDCLDFDTQLLMFPQRAAVGSTPSPTVNTVDIVSLDPDAMDGCECYTSIAIGALSFDAMAPIILVHGWNSGPWEFGPETPDPNGTCGNGEIGSDHGRATINTLVSAKAPLDCSIRIDRQALIDTAAQIMANGGPATRSGPPSPSVSQIVNTFGARHAHIITNSKGGLFTRAFLDINAGMDRNTQTGIISVTTLDTPHRGSVLSDTVVLYSGGIRSVLPLYARVFYFFGRLLPQVKNAFGAGNRDMTVDAVKSFNANHPTAPKTYQMRLSGPTGATTSLILNNPAYFSTSGNADLNANHKLEDNEAAPYFPPVANFQWKRIGRVQEFTVSTDSNGRTIATPVPMNTFLDNDVAVSISSARYPEGLFQEIKSYAANHASILCPVAGEVPTFCAPITSPLSDVLARIKAAEVNLDEDIQ